MSYYANRKPETTAGSGSGEQSPYQSVETSPSHSRSTSFESFQSAVLRQQQQRPVSNLPNSSSTTHDLTSMHHDPCIKVIQTSPSSVSLDKFAAHMAHSSSYSSLPPVPSSLAEFQSLPANIQHHQSSASQCKTSASMSAALAAARPLVHNVQDLESSFTSIPSAVSGPTTVKSLIDNAVDEQMRQYQIQQQQIQSSASSAMSYIDQILSNIKPATETKPESNEERTPYKATSESATQQASVRSPDQLMMNKQAQTNLSAPNMPYAHHVNTLSPNGSTINDAVAIFNLATASSSTCTQNSEKTPSKATSEHPVQVSSESKVVKSLEMVSLSSSSEPIVSLKSSESTESTKLTEGEEKKKDVALPAMPSTSPTSPKKEKDQTKSRNKTDKVKKDDKKEEKREKKEEKKDEKKEKSDKKKENNVSVTSSIKSETKKTEKSDKSEKKEKKDSKKSNKENKETKESKDAKKENAKESKSEEKKQQTVKTEVAAPSSTPSSAVPVSKDKEAAAAKPQREKPAKKQQTKSQKSKGNTTTESQQPSTTKSKPESKDSSDKKSNKKKTELVSHEKTKVDESSKSDQLIQMLLAKLEKMNCKPSGHKQSALINRIKYQPDLLKRIRDERHEFIEAIWPDIFKAYSYCMDGRHWNPEHYFDIVQSGGDYEKIQNVHGKKSSKPIAPAAYQPTHNTQYNHHSAMSHHQPNPYYKNNVNTMNNKRKFYDNNYHGGQYQQQQPHHHQYQHHQYQQSHQNRQYHNHQNTYNHHQYVSSSQSPEMPQVPRNSPKSHSEHNGQNLEMLGGRGSARPEQHILNMLGVKREDEERDSRLMNLLNRPAQTSHSMIENLLLAPKESKILTAHELEMMQLKESQKSTNYMLGDAMSDALRQLVKNLDNHPLSGGMQSSSNSKVPVEETSQFLKQMLKIQPDQYQQPENRLLASVNARQNKEKEHFQSLVLNKLMPTSQPADNIMKWFQN